MPRRVQVRYRAAHPPPVAVIHRDSPNPAGIRPVQVGIMPVAPLHTSVIKRPLHRRPLLPFPPHDGDGAVAAVKIVLNIQIGLGAAVERQHLQIAPFGVAERFPALEILRQPPQENLPVNRPGAADNLALRDVDFPLLVIDHPAQRPRHRRPNGLPGRRMSIAHRRRQLLRVGVIQPRLQQQHRPAAAHKPRILRQPPGHHRPRRPAAHHNNIVLHIRSSHKYPPHTGDWPRPGVGMMRLILHLLPTHRAYKRKARRDLISAILVLPYGSRLNKGIKLLTGDAR